MSSTTIPTTPSLEGPGHTADPLEQLTVADIDREMPQIAALLEHRSASTAMAVQLARRLQELHSARPIAVARERAQQREQEVERATQARVTFDGLEAELTAALREQAQALDVWVQDGRPLLSRYTATLMRVAADVQAVLAAPPPGREFHLADRLARLRLEEQLANHFTQLTGGRPAGSTLEAYVSHLATKFFAAARERLPVAPGPDDPHQEGG